MNLKPDTSHMLAISNLPAISIQRRFFIMVLVFFIAFVVQGQQKRTIHIIDQVDASPRMKFGADKLIDALKNAGYPVSHTSGIQASKNKNGVIASDLKNAIVIGELKNASIQKAATSLKISLKNNPGKEGYIIASNNNSFIVAGADGSGVLYACLELADQIQTTGKLPSAVSLTDQPEMVLRGACIGVQKPYYLPGRTVYEYPYTPETFPWFYDKKLWIQYLDSLVNNRLNSLYLWNGHPFASLVRLADYPYAVEVDEITFKKNEEIFKFLTTEADKRGIWVIQMFYNIIVSKPFAEKHQIKTQDRERQIMPLIADYTRKSIAAFVEKYPNVGLMVCLGEAMEGTGHDDVEWFTKTIIPGVQDGLKALRQSAEPPIVLRAHDTNAPEVMKAALPLYKNLYTEAKFNGEALTVPRPRGAWAELHQTLSRLGSVQIENVHIMANLEPFRYGSVDFIQQSVKGMHEVMGGNGLHLYPQASYWDWPYSADSVKGKRLLQIERDWIWYKAWARYAWKAGRDRNEELNYWSAILANKFGCTSTEGRKILEAYEQSGEIAPKLLRRFGITDGNRQTLTLGMLMTQLINPTRYGLFTLMYESESPVGEMLIDYAAKEWNKEKHIGETPVQIIREVREHGSSAVAAIDAAAGAITKNKEEFGRIRNDMYCYRALAGHYAAKAEAALHILRFKYSNDVKDLETALPLLEQSVSIYQQLEGLTKGSYLYANSMQTQQRKIPIRGVDGTFKTWTEVMVPFEKELNHFRHKIDSLKHQPSNPVRSVRTLQNERPVLGKENAGRYTVDSLAKVFADTSLTIRLFAEELRKLEGVQFSWQEQLSRGTSLSFSNPGPVNVLVGYFNSKETLFAKPPELETNASANEYGQAEIKIANSLVIPGLPPVNVHSYSFPAGTHILKINKGICLVLGFLPGKMPVPAYDAGLTSDGIKKDIDWLFE